MVAKGTMRMRIKETWETLSPYMTEHEENIQKHEENIQKHKEWIQEHPQDEKGIHHRRNQIEEEGEQLRMLDFLVEVVRVNENRKK